MFPDSLNRRSLLGVLCFLPLSACASTGTHTGGYDEHNAHSEKLQRVTTKKSYLIFVRKVARSSRSNLQRYGDVYQIEGGANGIFTVDGDTATPLGPGVPMTTASPAPSIPHTYSVKALMAVRIDE